MQKKRKTWKGVVVSDKMDKTIVVAVSRLVICSKYRKRYLKTKRFKVHDPENKYKKDNTVRFVECAPISREKRFRVQD